MPRRLNIDISPASQGDRAAIATRGSRPIHTTAGNHSGPKSERGFELYPTPPCAVEALLRAEKLPLTCWEPCGTEHSAIATVLRAHGKRVTCTDLLTDGIDFLSRRRAPGGAQAIVTNPPFSRAADFVRHGLELVPKVVILERIQFLESDERTDIIDGGRLARVLVFADRVPRMHRQDWTGKRSAAAMCLAWFAFERGHQGSWIGSRIRCHAKVGGFGPCPR
jgi:hypothetical protein